MSTKSFKNVSEDVLVRLSVPGRHVAMNALVTLAGHEKPVMSLAFNAAGTLLVSGGGDNSVRVWSVPG